MKRMFTFVRSIIGLIEEEKMLHEKGVEFGVSSSIDEFLSTLRFEDVLLAVGNY